MLARTTRAVLVLAVALLGTAVLAVPTSSAHSSSRSTEGSTGRAERTVTKRWIEITRIDGGFRYRASLHDNDLTITRVAARVLFADRAARRVRALPAGCRRVAVETGRAVSCRLPADPSPADPVLLDVEPGGGNDQVDASSLTAVFASSLLGALGDDELRAGAGVDFINGAAGVDQVDGGPGNDRIRTGDGNDVADGGVGDDVVLGTAGNDQLAGSVGDDRLEGGDGNDLLLGGGGSDVLLCGDGFDTADDRVADDDTSRHCEKFID